MVDGRGHVDLAVRYAAVQVREVLVGAYHPHGAWLYGGVRVHHPQRRAPGQGRGVVPPPVRLPPSRISPRQRTSPCVMAPVRCRRGRTDRLLARRRRAPCCWRRIRPLSGRRGLPSQTADRRCWRSASPVVPRRHPVSRDRGSADPSASRAIEPRQGPRRRCGRAARRRSRIGRHRRAFRAPCRRRARGSPFAADLPRPFPAPPPSIPVRPGPAGSCGLRNVSSDAGPAAAFSSRRRSQSSNAYPARAFSVATAVRALATSARARFTNVS